MMKLFAIKDDVAQTFIQVFPAQDSNVVRRDLGNAVNTPSKSLLFTNPEDFKVFTLGDYDPNTGEITSKINFEFNLLELKRNVN